MYRPLFNSSIGDLERLFDENRDNPDWLRALDAELVHRTTERATRL
jgi:hypothetical protein